MKAFDELIALKKKLKIKVPIIIHGFNKNKDVKQVPTWQKGGQIIVNSDRVTINAKDDKLLLIGKTDAILTAEKIKKYPILWGIFYSNLITKGLTIHFLIVNMN